MSGPVTNQNGEEITFRRIRGRIVPIKKKKQTSPARQKKAQKPSRKSEVAAGGAIFSTGILSGIFGGSVIAEFSEGSRVAKKASKDLFGRGARIAKEAKANTGERSAFLSKQAKTFKRAGARQRARSSRLSKQGFAIGAGAIAVGGFLSAAGLRRAAEGATGERTNLGEEAFTDLGSAAALAGAVNEFGLKKGIGRKSAARKLRTILSKGKL